MTALTANPIAARSSDAESTPLRRLRAVLMTNAATSFAGGAFGLATAPTLSDELGFDHVTLTRIISVGLMVFAIDVAILARSRTTRVMAWSPVVSVADLAWVAGTGVVIATGTLTTLGVIVSAALAVGVLDYALLQLWLRTRARI